MYEDFSDELISAYLDGELTGEQKARVETVLTDSPEHRQMFEELRGLRASLQSLPSYRLGDAFADRVLRAAGQATPASKVTADSKTAESPDGVRLDRKRCQVDQSKPAQSSHEIWRRPVFAVAAVAATLLLALFLRPTPNNNDQGMADSGRENRTEHSESVGDNATAAPRKRATADRTDELDSRVLPDGLHQPVDAPATATREADFATQPSLPDGPKPTAPGLNLLAELAQEKALLDAARLLSDQKLADSTVVLFVEAPDEFLAARPMDGYLQRHNIEIVQRGRQILRRQNAGHAMQDERVTTQRRMDRAAEKEVDGSGGGADVNGLDILVVEGTHDQITAAWSDFQELDGWYYRADMSVKGNLAAKLEAPPFDVELLDKVTTFDRLQRGANRDLQLNDARQPEAPASDGDRSFGAFDGGVAPDLNGHRFAASAEGEAKATQTLDVGQHAPGAATGDNESTGQTPAPANDEASDEQMRFRADRAGGPRPAPAAEKANEPNPDPVATPPNKPQAESAPSPDAGAGSRDQKMRSGAFTRSTIGALGDKDTPEAAERQNRIDSVVPHEPEGLADATGRPATQSKIKVMIVLRAVRGSDQVPGEAPAASASPALNE